MFTTDTAPSGATSFGALESARAAALDPAPGRLKRYRALALQSGLDAAPFSGVEAAKDAHHWGILYSDGRASPAAIRAALASDAADRDAYRAGQIERARKAVRDQFEADPERDLADYYDRQRLFGLLAQTAARATHASDGPESTIITAEDTVSVVAEFVPIADADEREDALIEAEDALRDYHVGWRDATPEEDREAAEAEAEMNAFLLADAVFAALPADADFPAALRAAHPILAPESAAGIAGGMIRRLSKPPTHQYIPDFFDPFGGGWAEPDEAAIQLHGKALMMGNLSFLKLVEPMALWTGKKMAPTTFNLETEPGLLGDLARWTQTYAYRPVREFAAPAALAVLATIFGRRWSTPTGLGLNLYQVAIADTGGGKDALISAPKALLAAADLRHLIGPGDFTSDSAIEMSLRARPSQLMALDEFGKLAQAMMGRNAPHFAKLAAKALLEIYPRSAPGSEWTGKQRAGGEIDNAAEPIFSPTLQILGVSTPAGFFDGMTEENLDDGFLNRLTLYRAAKAGARQRDPARLTPPPALVAAIRSAYAASAPSGNLAGLAERMAVAAPSIRFARWADDDAIAEIETVEAWEDEAVEGGRKGAAGRTAEQTLKIATIRALARHPADPAVTAADILWAFSIVRTSIETIEDGARSMMSGSQFEALVNAVEAAARKAGEKGIPWSHLVKAKGVSKCDDRQVEAAVKRLEIAELVWADIGATARGPKAVRRVRIRQPGWDG